MRKPYWWLGILLAWCGDGKPTAVFTAPATGTALQAVVFDGSASKGGTGKLSYAWDFGDKTRGSSAKLAHLFAEAGAHVVTLTVADDKGRTAQVQHTVTIAAAAAPTGTVNATIKVTDVSGTAISGATVAVVLGGSATAQSDSQGKATVSVGIGAHAAIKVSKAGFSEQILAVDLPSVADQAQLEATLMAREAAQALDIDKGGEIVARDGARVTLPPSALVDGDGKVVTGTVQVTLTAVDVTNEKIKAFPGDFSGVVASGETKPIASFGTSEYILEANGQRLQLAPGKKAIIDVPTYASKGFEDGAALKAGDTFPLWALDEKTGIWVQEGTGEVVASPTSPTGLALRGEVTHLSWWNHDVDYEPAEPTIKCEPHYPGPGAQPIGQICHLTASDANEDGTFPFRQTAGQRPKTLKTIAIPVTGQALFMPPGRPVKVRGCWRNNEACGEVVFTDDKGSHLEHVIELAPPDTSTTGGNGGGNNGSTTGSTTGASTGSTTATTGGNDNGAGGIAMMVGDDFYDDTQERVGTVASGLSPSKRYILTVPTAQLVQVTVTNELPVGNTTLDGSLTVAVKGGAFVGEGLLGGLTKEATVVFDATAGGQYALTVTGNFIGTFADDGYRILARTATVEDVPALPFHETLSSANGGNTMDVKRYNFHASAGDTVVAVLQRSGGGGNYGHCVGYGEDGTRFTDVLRHAGNGVGDVRSFTRTYAQDTDSWVDVYVDWYGGPCVLNVMAASDLAVGATVAGSLDSRPGELDAYVLTGATANSLVAASMKWDSNVGTPFIHLIDSNGDEVEARNQLEPGLPSRVVQVDGNPHVLLAYAGVGLTGYPYHLRVNAVPSVPTGRAVNTTYSGDISNDGVHDVAQLNLSAGQPVRLAVNPSAAAPTFNLWAILREPKGDSKWWPWGGPFSYHAQSGGATSVSLAFGGDTFLDFGEEDAFYNGPVTRTFTWQLFAPTATPLGVGGTSSSFAIDETNFAYFAVTPASAGNVTFSAACTGSFTVTVYDGVTGSIVSSNSGSTSVSSGPQAVSAQLYKMIVWTSGTASGCTASAN